MKKTIITMVLALLCGLTAAQAQVPCPGATRWNGLRVNSKTRVIQVDGTGKSGDFKKISDALACVALQTRDQYNQWTVEVYPGDGHDTTGVPAPAYTETRLVVPSYTSVQGKILKHSTGSSITGLPLIEMIGTSGTLVSLDKGSALSHLEIFMTSTHVTPTGNIKVVAHDQGTGGGNGVQLWNIWIGVVNLADTFNIDLFSNDVGGSSLFEVSTDRSGIATHSRNIVNNETAGNGMTMWFGRTTSGTNQVKIFENAGSSNSAMNLISTRITNRTPGTISSPITTDLAGTSGPINETFVDYANESGTVNHQRSKMDALRLSVSSTPASATAPCIKGDITYDSSFIYICTATNTWVRSALATW